MVHVSVDEELFLTARINARSSNKTCTACEVMFVLVILIIVSSVKYLACREEVAKRKLYE